MGPHPTNHFRNLLIPLTPTPGSSNPDGVRARFLHFQSSPVTGASRGILSQALVGAEAWNRNASAHLGSRS